MGMVAAGFVATTAAGGMVAETVAAMTTAIVAGMVAEAGTPLSLLLCWYQALSTWGALSTKRTPTVAWARLCTNIGRSRRLHNNLGEGYWSR